MAVDRVAPRRVRDRMLPMAAAVLLPTVVLWGFARTYYLRGLLAGPPLHSSLVHLHGALMTAWVALFVAQVGLVSTGRTGTHRRLGVLGGFLAALLVPVGLLTAVGGAAHGAGPPGVPPLVFMVVPTMDMVVFVLLAGTALAYRRRPDVHRRLMILTAFNFLPPAVARIPLDFIRSGGLPVVFGLADGLLLAAVAYDTWRHRRLHPAMAAGALLILLSLPLRLVVGGTEGWLHFATWATGHFPG